MQLGEADRSRLSSARFRLERESLLCPADPCCVWVSALLLSSCPAHQTDRGDTTVLGSGHLYLAEKWPQNTKIVNLI